MNEAPEIDGRGHGVFFTILNLFPPARDWRVFDENSTFAGSSCSCEQLKNAASIRSDQQTLGFHTFGFHGDFRETLLSQARRHLRLKPGRASKNRSVQTKNIQIPVIRALALVLNQIFPSRSEKNHLHSFFCGGRIRDGSGIRSYGAFSLFEKMPELLWGVVHVTLFRSMKAIGLSQRPNELVRRCVPPCLDRSLNFPFAYRVES